VNDHGPGDLPAAERPRGSVRLTARQAQVLSLILRGFGNKEIAGQLGVVEQSIKESVSTLLRKFNVANRSALTSAGLRLQLAGTEGLEPSWVPQLLRDSNLLVSVLAGRELRIVAVSEGLTQRLGGRELIGRPVREAIPEYASTGYFELVDRVFETGEPFIVHGARVELVSADGPRLGYRDVIIQALRGDDGEINGVVYFGIDVTAQVLEANTLPK
jgi:DNA-binding CsgD family transcriptional regulator